MSDTPAPVDTLPEIAVETVPEAVPETAPPPVETASMPEKVDIYVRRLYVIIKDRVNLQDLLPTAIELVREIEKIKEIDGKEKLELLLDTLRYAVMASTVGSDEKNAALFVIKNVIPIAVRAMIIGSKSPLVAQIEAGVVGCFGRLFRR
jgi:hypothetical protein